MSDKTAAPGVEGGTLPESMLGKVRGLLAKAEHENTSPDEAEAYMGKALKLMAKYGIERARLAVDNPDTGKIIHKVVPMSEPYARLSGYLLIRLIQAMNGEGVLHGRRRNDGTRYANQIVYEVHMFAAASDLERAEMLFTSLLVQRTMGVAAVEVPSWAKPKAYRRGWVVGFDNTVQARVREFEQRAAADAAFEPGSTGLELVLVDRKQAAKAAVRREFPNTKTSRVSADRRGYHDGAAAGCRADIGVTKVGYSSRSLPTGN